MQTSVNPYTAPPASQSSYPQFTQGAPVSNEHTYTLPYRTEYSDNMKISSDPIAGNLRPSSTPSSSVLHSLDSFVATQQVLRPSNRDARCTRHVPSITDPTAPVMQNSPQFSGDHRFPPGRPPIRQTGRPNQTFAINAAFAAWHQPPSDEPVNLAASSAALHKLLHAPPMAAAPISTQQLKPFKEMDPTSAICDPSPFADPEHEVHAIDCSGKPHDTEAGNAAPSEWPEPPGRSESYKGGTRVASSHSV